MGISSGNILLLKRLDAAGIGSAMEDAQHFFQVHVDNEQLGSALEGAFESMNDEEMQLDFIRREAPFDLMSSLFKISTGQFCKLRQLAGIKTQRGPKGSEQKADETMGDVIWRLWQKYSLMTEENRYIRITDETGATIYTVYATVKERLAWDQMRANYRASKPQLPSLCA